MQPNISLTLFIYIQGQGVNRRDGAENMEKIAPSGLDWKASL